MKYHLTNIIKQILRLLFQAGKCFVIVLLLNACSDNGIEDGLIVAEDFETTVEEEVLEGDLLGAVIVSNFTGQDLTYVIESQTPEGAIEINASTGVITVADAQLFFNGESEINAIFSAFSDSGDRDAASITINVIPRNPSSDRTSFVTTWRVFTAGESITIPTFPGLTYDYTVNWGDGSETKNETGDATHVYSTAGIYEVSISGTFPAIYFNFRSGRDRILTIEQWGDIEWTTMQDAFEGCYNLTYNARDVPDLSRVTDMSRMFSSANRFDGFIDNWDVSNVTNMSRLFYNAHDFNSPLNSWDVSNVTNMLDMFENARAFNQPLDQWKVSNVTNMSDMFEGATDFNQPIGKWDVSNVTSMFDMFEDATSFNQPLNDWNVSNVTNMGQMFDNAASFNQPLNNWNVSNVSTMSDMFERASSFNQPLDNWDVSNVNSMRDMFENATAFNQDLSGWSVDNVTSCSDFDRNSGLTTDNLPNFTSCTP